MAHRIIFNGPPFDRGDEEMEESPICEECKKPLTALYGGFCFLDGKNYHISCFNDLREKARKARLLKEQAQLRLFPREEEEEGPDS